MRSISLVGKIPLDTITKVRCPPGALVWRARTLTETTPVIFCQLFLTVCWRAAQPVSPTTTLSVSAFNMWKPGSNKNHRQIRSMRDIRYEWIARKGETGESQQNIRGVAPSLLLTTQFRQIRRNNASSFHSRQAIPIAGWPIVSFQVARRGWAHRPRRG